jgi:hypothetical protein
MSRSCYKSDLGGAGRIKELQMSRAPLWAAAALAAVVGMAGALHAQSKDGRDRRVVIINDRTWDMVRLYGSRITTEDWEENIITTSIPSGARRVINFDDGTGGACSTFAPSSGTTSRAHKWSINVCREKYWRVVD